MTCRKSSRFLTFIFTVALLTVLALMITGASADAARKVYKSGDFRYKFDKNGSVTITAYKGKDKKVEIPNAIKNHMVRTIGKDAFRSRYFITKLILPYGLKTIESSAFEGCYEMKTKLPDGLETIGSNAFNSCEKLSKLKLPSSLKKIGEYAFFDCGMTKVVIPGKIKKVGDHAFSDATKVTLGKAFRKWNWKSFASDRDALSLKQIKVSSKNRYFSVKKGVLYDKNKTHLVFANCAANAKVSLPKTVRVIDTEAFLDCELTSLRLNDGLETISDNAFDKVEGLESISIPSTVNFLGRSSLVTSAEELILETRLLTENSIRGCLKDSNIKTISVQVGSKTSNRKYTKKYKKIFTKKITKSENELEFIQTE